MRGPYYKNFIHFSTNFVMIRVLSRHCRPTFRHHFPHFIFLHQISPYSCRPRDHSNPALFRNHLHYNHCNHCPQNHSNPGVSPLLVLLSLTVIALLFLRAELFNQIQDVFLFASFVISFRYITSS